MTVELERALRRKCETDERLRLLQAQWEYDRLLVRDALQAVSANFPHYSKHDASHSDTILLQITRVLGARIEGISASDLWLLLEAAYWHDSGMVIDAETAQRWWVDDSFKKHLADLQAGSDAMLAEAARVVSELPAPTSTLWPLEVRKAVTLVLADYGRGQHAVRSGDAIRHPLQQGIRSPRTLALRQGYGDGAMHRDRSTVASACRISFRHAELPSRACRPRLMANFRNRTTCCKCPFAREARMATGIEAVRTRVCFPIFQRAAGFNVEETRDR
jgi:hypothetical protein